MEEPNQSGLIKRREREKSFNINLRYVDPNKPIDYNNLGYAIALTNSKFLRKTLETKNHVLHKIPYIKIKDIEKKSQAMFN